MIPLRILNVVGGPRNFIKMAPIMVEMRRSREVEPILVHTGQHNRGFFPSVFFRDLGLAEPDFVLDVESSSDAKQTAAIIDRFEDTVLETRPDLVLVIGDVNSTVAASMTAVKMGVPVAHVEAGLRSFDRADPREINRVMTDAISDFLFVTEESAVNNLMGEGIDASRIHFVGNVLVDTLRANADRILESTVVTDLGLSRDSYAVLTLRSPTAADGPQPMKATIEALEKIQSRVPVVFPVDVETATRLHGIGFWQSIQNLPNVMVVEPIAYFDFIALLQCSRMVLTDTSGVQEEATALQVPCLTLRSRTERPATVSSGTNLLVGRDPHVIVAEAMRILRGDAKEARVPPMWDGRAACRLVAQILKKREEVLELHRNVRRTNECTAISEWAM